MVILHFLCYNIMWLSICNPNIKECDINMNYTLVHQVYLLKQRIF